MSEQRELVVVPTRALSVKLWFPPASQKFFDELFMKSPVFQNINLPFISERGA